MRKTNFIFVGHSHINALIAAAAESEDSERLHFVHLIRDAGNEPLLSKGEDGRNVLNQSIEAKLTGLCRKNSTAVVVSLIGGNAHNTLALIEHPQPFDFILPGENENTGRDRHYIPYRQMYNLMYGKSQYFFDVFDLIRASCDVPIYHLESPPPIGSDEHIWSHLDPFFEKQEGNKTLSPRNVRHKLWRLHSKTYIDYCKKNGVNFICSPNNAHDKDGFLHELGYPGNATHGNKWYGEQVIVNLVGRA